MSTIPDINNEYLPVLPNPTQDLISIGLERARKALNNQRVLRAPTDEELSARQDIIQRRINVTPAVGSKSEIPSEFDNRVDLQNETLTQNSNYLEQHELGSGPISINETEIGKVYTNPSQRIDRDLSIIDTNSGKSIKLPFVPRELRYTPDSHFKAIASMGRNNPFYHFTGSEDTLEFEIDWFAEKDSRHDVILNCKWVGSSSKNDGYELEPPAVILHWNSSLFSDSLWLVVAAPYRLLDFQAHRSMLPQQAYQQVTLKRVTLTNLRRREIQSITV